MKKYLLIFLAAPFAFTSCNQKKVDALQSQVDSLSMQSADYQKGYEDAQTQISDYLSSFNEIESNLEEIKKNEGVLTNNLSGESKPSQKQSIISSINSLNELIQKNKTLVADLDKKYKNANYKNKELDKMVASLNEQITQKEADLAMLKTELEKSNYQVATLTTELTTVSEAKTQLEGVNAEQATVIEKQTTDLNTAYYVEGSYKELRDAGVVDKEGGFIGLGKSKTLAEDFNTSAFTKIDIRSFKELPINSKSAKIVTDHPTQSFTLVEGDKSIEELVINNPNDFWKSSKYLVVLTD